MANTKFSAPTLATQIMSDSLVITGSTGKATDYKCVIRSHRVIQYEN